MRITVSFTSASAFASRSSFANSTLDEAQCRDQLDFCKSKLRSSDLLHHWKVETEYEEERR